jgi:hypothetical protein
MDRCVRVRLDRFARVFYATDLCVSVSPLRTTRSDLGISRRGDAQTHPTFEQAGDTEKPIRSTGDTDKLIHSIGDTHIIRSIGDTDVIRSIGDTDLIHSLGDTDMIVAQETRT